jgi:hypothetical protein
MSSALTYITNEKMVFTNGKSLVYRSKKGLLVTLKRFLPYHTSISTIAALIYFNPCKFYVIQSRPSSQLQFQSSGSSNSYVKVPSFLVIKMMFKRYQWNQSIVHEIYLLQSGSTTEVHFADNTRRKLFGEPQLATYYNTIFSDPI